MTSEKTQHSHERALPSRLMVDVSGGESVTLEFKKSTAEKEKACRTLCAFANGQGGDLIFGVTPSGKVVGQKVTDRTLEELAQEFQGFEPGLHPHIQRIPRACPESPLFCSGFFFSPPIFHTSPTKTCLLPILAFFSSKKPIFGHGLT